MAYSIDTRKIVLGYRDGHTNEETHKELGVSISAIYRWRHQLRDTGTLEDKELQRQPRKLPDEELKAYISEHPDAYFIEIAKHFNCSDEAVRKACKRLGITRKKKNGLYKERDEEKRAEYLETIKDISP